MVDTLAELPEGTRFLILAPIVRGRKGEYRHVFEDARKAGFARVRVDGTRLPGGRGAGARTSTRLHDIEVVVDRLVAGPEMGNRVADSLETALKLGDGLVLVNRWTASEQADGEDLLFSESYSCPVHNGHLPRADRAPHLLLQLPPRRLPGLHRAGHDAGDRPRAGRCPTGTSPSRTGRSRAWPITRDGYYTGLLESVAKHYGFSLNEPVESLTDEQLQVLLYGSGDERIPLRFQSHKRGRALRVPHRLRRGGAQSPAALQGDGVRPRSKEELERYMMNRPCPECGGARLKPASLAVTVAELNIAQVTALSVGKAVQFFDTLEGKLSEREALIARQILKEIGARLRFLLNVGLDYLTLDRAAGTLSGGEAQRIRLATQIGSGLMGVLYILDEPSIGLHQRDNARLIETLLRLRDLGNTLLVVEHDEDTIRAADWVVDIGPGAGEHGGHVVANGTLARGDGHPGLAHRAVPLRAPPDRGAGRAAPGERPAPAHRRRPGEQPQGRGRGDPARHLHRRHRRLRVGQVHPGDGHPLPAPGAAPAPGPRAPRGARARSRAWSTWTR